LETLRLKVDPRDLASQATRSAITRAAEILRAGGTVAFPTETVYGLGANALDAEAVKKIFAAKQRPGWDPVIVHVGERTQVNRVAAEVPESAAQLMEAFWPGPLTLLLPRSTAVPERVTAGLERVGVRMPAHPVAAALLREAGVPVAAPSANRFGRTSATTAEHVAEDLAGRIDAILDGGPTTHGVESTVVEARTDGCIVYRPGVVTLEQIRAVCGGRVILRQGISEEAPVASPAPGMGMRHYAPRARMVLVDGEGRGQADGLALALQECEAAGERVGLMLPVEFGDAAKGAEVRVWRWGRWGNPEELAQRLFAGLRWLDSEEVTAIVCPLPAAEGVGLAVRDRLLRAARGRQTDSEEPAR
jgi:L-threonylcarbamoyladenylate synthase